MGGEKAKRSTTASLKTSRKMKKLVLIDKLEEKKDENEAK